FIVNQNIYQIEELIESNDFRDVMLICSDSQDASSDAFIDFATSAEVKYIVSKENRTLKRRLRDSGKKLIRLDSCFQPQQRNADYLRIIEEKFTEEQLFYAEDGYFGFSDFTTLSDEYTEGGTTPYAISIHLTYQ